MILRKTPNDRPLLFSFFSVSYDTVTGVLEAPDQIPLSFRVSYRILRGQTCKCILPRCRPQTAPDIFKSSYKFCGQMYLSQCKYQSADKGNGDTTNKQNLGAIYCSTRNFGSTFTLRATFSK